MSGPAFDLSDLYAPPQSSGTLDLSSVLGPSSASDRLLAQFRSGQLAKRMAAANQRDQQNLQDEQASTPNLLSQGLQRGAASLLSDAQTFPGVAAGEAYLGKLGSHIPRLTPDTGPLSYSQSLAALQDQTSQIPAAARVAGQTATGMLAFGGLPKMAVEEGAPWIRQLVPRLLRSPTATAGALGALQGASDPNPDLGSRERVSSAAGDALRSMLFAKVMDLGITGLRTKYGAPTPGAAANALEQNIGQASGTAYGQAAIEGQNAVATNHPGLSTLQSALDHPLVKPYADAVRSTDEFANADAPTVAQKAYQLMSERQRTLNARGAADPTNFKAGTSLDLSDINAAKNMLLSGTDEVMPSFRNAVAQRARMEGERDAFELGRDAAIKATQRSQVPGQQLITKSPEAVRSEIAAMSPAEASQAVTGILGTGGENIGKVIPHPTTILNPFTGFGIPRSVAASNAFMRLLRSAEQASGSSTGRNLQGLITFGANNLLHP